MITTTIASTNTVIVSKMDFYFFSYLNINEAINDYI